MRGHLSLPRQPSDALAYLLPPFFADLCKLRLHSGTKEAMISRQIRIPKWADVGAAAAVGMVISEHVYV